MSSRWTCSQCGSSNSSYVVKCECGIDVNSSQNVPSSVFEAKTAWQSGAKLFQCVIPLSATVGSSTLLAEASSATEQINQMPILDLIEAEGWRLEHVNYVYRLTGSESSYKDFVGSQHSFISGTTDGIYLFRRTDRQV